jgi:hypothetical protein
MQTELRSGLEFRIDNMETVFKSGFGYDAGKLIESVRGRWGIGEAV